MAENSKIEWCDHTVNLWWGCFEVHKGCDHCYAKTLANRYHSPDVLWQQQGPRMYIKSAFADLNRYQARAAKENRQYIIFMNSMSDIFEKSMPVVDFKHQQMRSWRDPSKDLMTEEIREHFFNVVDCSPNLLFLLLTKRPSNIPKMVPADWLVNPRKNVMYGTSVVDQETADTLIPQLLNVPGYHFLSMEPLVGPVNLCQSIRTYQFTDYRSFHSTWFGDKLHWVIIGGESGIGTRPMNSAWVKDIFATCSVGHVAVFFKQWGEWLPLDFKGLLWPDEASDGSGRTFYYENDISHKFTRSNDQLFYRIGKKEAGALLFGKPHKNFPITVWPR